MKRVILVTGHYLESKRKAGFHWLAEAYWRAGWEVIFLTTAISWLSWAHRNYRMAYPIRREANCLRWVQPGLASYVWFTPWHPADLRAAALNRLTSGLFARYGHLALGPVEALIGDAHLVIFESTPGLLLFERFRHLCPGARYVYRVSDDLQLIRCHPVVIEAETRIAPHVDLVSVPSRALLQRFRHLPQAALQHHGIRKELFDQDYPSPYGGTAQTQAVFVGTSLFDSDFLGRAARHFPEWLFHIIGPLPNLPRRANIRAYGEMPFRDTVPYLKHADIGLNARACTTGIESLTDSLKVLQYTYCRLPIVAPASLTSARAHIFYYAPGNDTSIAQALIEAKKYARHSIKTDDILSWDDLARLLAGSGP